MVSDLARAVLTLHRLPQELRDGAAAVRSLAIALADYEEELSQEALDSDPRVV